MKTVDFSETIAASYLKVSRSSHLIEYMNVCEYWRSRSYLDLGPRSCTYKHSNLTFSETTLPTWTKFFMKAFRYKKMKIWWHDAGPMTKMAAMPIYGRNPLKIFFSGTSRPISTKLGMQHRGLKPIIVRSNDDPRVTLACFTAMSNLAA